MNKIHLFLDQMINTSKTQNVKKACLDTFMCVQPHARSLRGGVAVPGKAANALPVRLRDLGGA